LVGLILHHPWNLKNIKALALKAASVYVWAVINTGMGWSEYQHAHGLTRATILGTLCRMLDF